MPWSPRATAASMAAIWVVSSPSSLPAAVVIETLLALPASSAPFCIAMKNGLVLVLVIRVTATSSPPPPPPPGGFAPRLPGAPTATGGKEEHRCGAHSHGRDQAPASTVRR